MELSALCAACNFPLWCNGPRPSPRVVEPQTMAADWLDRIDIKILSVLLAGVNYPWPLEPP